jgi:hypothetical protein
MDESAEDVATPKVLERHRGRRVRRRVIGCAKTQTAMRPAPIVVTDEVQHSLEMAAVDDEQMATPNSSLNASSKLTVSAIALRYEYRMSVSPR